MAVVDIIVELCHWFEISEIEFCIKFSNTLQEWSMVAVSYCPEIFWPLIDEERTKVSLTYDIVSSGLDIEALYVAGRELQNL